MLIFSAAYGPPLMGLPSPTGANPSVLALSLAGLWVVLLLVTAAMGAIKSTGGVRSEVEVTAVGLTCNGARIAWADIGDIHWEREGRALMIETGAGGQQLGLRVSEKTAKQLIELLETHRPELTGHVDQGALKAIAALRDKA